jgi:hypothetical protein
MELLILCITNESVIPFDLNSNLSVFGTESSFSLNVSDKESSFIHVQFCAQLLENSIDYITVLRPTINT